MEEQDRPRHYDCIVVGVGSGGFGAALAAARGGLSVLCLEKADRIGGNAVRSGVSMWESGVGGTGFPFEIYNRLTEIPHAVGIYSFGRHMSWDGPATFPGGEHVIDPQRKYVDTLRRHRSRTQRADAAFRKATWHGVVFEPEAYERVLKGMLLETERITLLTRTTFTGVRCSGGRIIDLTLTSGERVTASYYVDSTGDGVLCRAAGGESLYGQEGTGAFGEPSAPGEPNDRINGVTLIFRVTRASTARVEPLPDGVAADCWWGRFPAMSAVRYPNGDYNCNMLPTLEGRDFTRLGYARAYEECRRRVYAYWHHVQTKWPEFRSCRLVSIAPALGIRETTRVRGEYVLREQDLRAGCSGQTHQDIIAIADHALDRHGTGGGALELGEPYGIPYRSLIPHGMKNVLVACRGASFTSIAASSCRLSRTMMQLGQAAGTAAVLAKTLAVDLPDVPPAALRRELRAQHVEVGWPRPTALAAYLEQGGPADFPPAMLWRKTTIPAALRTKARGGNQDLDFGGDLRIGDLTGNGQVDFVVYRSDAESEMKPCFLGAFTVDGEILWQLGGGGRQPLRPGPVALHDFDGDGRDEVLCFYLDRSKKASRDSLSNVSVQMRDGGSGRVLREAAPAAVTARKGWGPNWCHQRLLIANLRGGNRPRDFVVKLGDTVVALDDELNVLWTYTIRWNEYGRCSAYIPAVGDMDGDGRDEVNGGHYLLDSAGRPLWEKVLGPHMDSVAIVEWDGGNRRAVCSGGGHVVDREGRPILQLGSEVVPHGQEARVADFIAESPGPELALRYRGHTPDVLVVGVDGKILSRFRWNSSPNETGMETVYFRGPGERALLYNGGCLFDARGRIATKLPGLPPPVGPTKMGWYHSIAANVAGDAREEVVVYNPWATSVSIYTPVPFDASLYERYRPGPRQYNVRLMD